MTELRDTVAQQLDIHPVWGQSSLSLVREMSNVLADPWHPWKEVEHERSNDLDLWPPFLKPSRFCLPSQQSGTLLIFSYPYLKNIVQWYDLLQIFFSASATSQSRYCRRLWHLSEFYRGCNDCKQSQRNGRIFLLFFTFFYGNFSTIQINVTQCKVEQSILHNVFQHWSGLPLWKFK